MRKNVYFLSLAMLASVCYLTPVNAQEPAAADAKPAEEEKAWKTTAGLGLDFAQLFIHNPRQGAGQNRVGFGSAVNIAALYKKDRIAWDNLLLWQFGIQRLGSGVIAQGTNDNKIPFQKAIDELRLNSKIGYKISETSKFFYAADVSFLSQLTPTYRGSDDYPGNFLTDITDTDATPLSKLFSPATITVSVGIDYKPLPNLSFYYSPVGAKFIVVSDDEIARLGIHGNPVDGTPVNGIYPEFDNTFSQLGSLLRMNYVGKYFKEKLSYTSALTLFSNYIEKPQNVDVDWTNEFGFVIIKGLQASILVNVFYDDDVRVQISDSNATNGVSGLGRATSITQQFLLKYNVTF